MIISEYLSVFNEYFTREENQKKFSELADFIVDNKPRLFFVGNGGSNAICSHMFEDFAKVARYQAFSFTDSALITCFANDYGYENAMAEWLKVYLRKGDVLVGISSSGNSMNIVNALTYGKSIGATVVSCSAFEPSNKINQIGDFNFHIPVKNYGIAECFHQVILHAVLDEVVVKNNALKTV